MDTTELQTILDTLAEAERRARRPEATKSMKEYREGIAEGLRLAADLVRNPDRLKA